MKAAVMRAGALRVDELPDPVPEAGQVLVKTLACGICGSDLHALQHSHELVNASREVGASFDFDPDRDVVMGHEFCVEILDHGPGTQGTLPLGSRACSLPVVAGRDGAAATVGYSNDYPGGYGELMVLNEDLLLPVPNGLSTEHAALTEPLAVGWHAVAKANLQGDETPLVIGCGPVGLAVIAALKKRGVGPIVAADFSPTRRAMAEALGADDIIDPAQDSPYTRWAQRGGYDAPPDPLGANAFSKPVMFECVGVPGVIEQLMLAAPRDARIVVVGVCMEHDRIQPFQGIVKELSLQFVLAYTAEEFGHTLQLLGDGEMDGQAMLTGRVGLSGVVQAFQDLGDPEAHAKILVEPWRS
ncbi:MAG: zinc-binding dehydrogenase [Pseudomonadota bacterium]